MKILESENYHKVTNHLMSIKINNLFARSVIEKRISGMVFVDNIENPKTFYVVHPYGMSLLFGDSKNIDFNNEFLNYSININRTRNKHEWMQAYSNDWDKVLSELYGNRMIKSTENKEFIEIGIVELNTRVNFKINREKYISNKKMNLPQDCEIERTDEQIYNEMKGSVIPSNFWDNVNDFIENGIGFSLLYKNQLAATAYSAFIHDKRLEIGIETISDFQGKGFAQLVCSALIDYCFENDFEPVWACRLENVGSFKLAEKLGFEPISEIPYYRLSR
ncbi:GNAT family N-acetyltransferase [uncultured Lutibacter sp.]|mgnify:CR=1 FL=1|uniref:GNAT family N-acetyltransferase n=1 Tax=uncultured Lutibacter sp. TaxID=437739 RepID=UPI002605EEA1|nr:GNAT family N-acetyltransferase [uncultured Lutibacter sp.]